MAESESSTNSDQNNPNKEKIKGDNYLFAVGMDFGTTYSGYAFSSRNDYQKDPLKISCNLEWKSGGTTLMSMKTPTSILMEKDGSFVAFGYEAEDQFYTEMDSSDRRNLMLFRRFKMKLHNKTGISENMKIEDVTGREYSAKTVFILFIKALADHFKEYLKATVSGELNDDDIKWVLTVPAIWSDAAKKYMRNCATEAGLPDTMLNIALEPEAASIYAQYLPIKKNEDGLAMTAAGTKYMVVDIGGGTADITVHEKIRGGKLKEIHQATGGACGGTSVDKAFENRLTEILGEAVMKKLKEEEAETFLDIFREFEVVKRGIKPNSKNSIRITIPYVTLNHLCNEIINKDLDEVFRNISGIKIKGDKLHIDADIMKQFFQQPIGELLQCMESVLTNPRADGVSIILLVGGSADSALIQDEIRKQFPSKELVIPPEAGLAVLRGAVIFGHCPNMIKSRILRYTYGVEVTPDFDPDTHKEEKKITIGGKDRCKGCFSAIISAGREVEMGHQVQVQYVPTHVLQQEALVQVFCSPKKEVKYTDDEECFLLGELHVSLDPINSDSFVLSLLLQTPLDPFRIVYTFGDTELAVRAVDMAGNETSCILKMREESLRNSTS